MLSRSIYICFLTVAALLGAPVMAGEVRFTEVKLELSSPDTGDPVGSAHFVIEVGKTTQLRFQSKSNDGGSTEWRADFSVDNTFVSDKGVPVAATTLRLYRGDRSLKRWVLVREQSSGLRLGGVSAKVRVESAGGGKVAEETSLSVAPLSESEVLSRFGRTTAKTACPAATLDYTFRAKSFDQGGCPGAPWCDFGGGFGNTNCCSFTCADGRTVTCCNVVWCSMCDKECSP